MSLITSKLTGKSYNVEDVVRIVNVLQLSLYIENGVELIDIYTSRDYKTKKPILVAVFDKNNSAWAYDLWCKHELV